MTTIYIKLKNPSETVVFQSIMGAYSHLAWVRTEDSEKGMLVRLFTTEDLIEELKEALGNLRAEIEFEEVHI